MNAPRGRAQDSVARVPRDSQRRAEPTIEVHTALSAQGANMGLGPEKGKQRKRFHRKTAQAARAAQAEAEDCTGRVGFEPTEPRRARHVSSVVRSTAPPPPQVARVV